MLSLAREACWIAALFCLMIEPQANSSQDAEPEGAVSGRVTINGEPAPRVYVVMTSFGDSAPASRPLRAITDREGNYRLAGVPEGRYQINPVANSMILEWSPGFGRGGMVVSGGPAPSSIIVTVARDEELTGVDFALAPGGVITGRVTDADGRPLIEASVSCNRINEQGHFDNFSHVRSMTDDRGIYRVYGLPAGEYLVSVIPRGVVGKHYQQTFHPGVIDQSRAARVKVVAGRESTSVDIKVGQPEETYLISGRVIDAVSGNPIPDVPIRFVGYLGDSSRHGGVQSGPQGEFKVEHCPPGRYALEIGPYGGINKGYFSDPVVFEVADGDVTGVEIKGYRGASISGIAVIESATDPTLLAKLTNRIVSAFWTPGEGRRPDVPGSAGRDQASTQIGPDGRFEITGLRQVRVRITAGSLPEGFMFLRAERNGVPIKDGIDLNPGEAITDLRLVFAYGTGSIRGRARAEGGTLPERMLWIITARRADGEQVFFDMIESRGYFRIKGLAPGEYEVEAIADYTPIPGVTPSPHPGPVRQKVSVVNGVETEVNLILDLSRTGKE